MQTFLDNHTFLILESDNRPIRLHCNIKSATNIAHNSVQYDYTKHVEVDRHFIKEKLDNGLVCTP